MEADQSSTSRGDRRECVVAFRPVLRKSDIQRARNVHGPAPLVEVHVLPTTPQPAISEQQIWLIAFGLIALDLTLFMVPVVPFLAAYVLLARPSWFKDFIDDVYDRSSS